MGIIPMLKNRGNYCAAMIHMLLLTTPAFAASEGGRWEDEYPAKSDEWYPCNAGKTLLKKWHSNRKTRKQPVPLPFEQAPGMKSTCLEANGKYYLEVEFNEDPNLLFGYEGHFDSDWSHIEKYKREFPDLTASDLRSARPKQGTWKRTKKRNGAHTRHRVRYKKHKTPETLSSTLYDSDYDSDYGDDNVRSYGKPSQMISPVSIEDLDYINWWSTPVGKKNNYGTCTPGPPPYQPK